MCITRVGKVLSVAGGKAKVEFFDDRVLGDVDVAVVGEVKRGAFVEVFGNLALSVLSPPEARKRKKAWEEVRRAAML